MKESRRRLFCILESSPVRILVWYCKASYPPLIIETYCTYQYYSSHGTVLSRVTVRRASTKGVERIFPEQRGNGLGFYQSQGTHDQVFHKKKWPSNCTSMPTNTEIEYKLDGAGNE
eukprot:IDg3350t1